MELNESNQTTPQFFKIPSSKNINKEVEERILTPEEIERQIRINHTDLKDIFRKL